MPGSATSTTLKVIAVGFLIFFAGFLMLSAPLYRNQYRILKNWPAAEARVVSSRVVAWPTRSGEMLYDAEYVFMFAVHGQPAMAVSFSNHQSTSRERKERQVASFPPGMRATVLYNPLDPTDIRMQPGYNVHFFAVPLFVSGLGAICGIVALMLWGLAQLLERRRRV